MNITAQEIVDRLQLIPHPEGGFYSEPFRDTGLIPKSVLPQQFKGDRRYSTQCYYLLPKGSFSALHRIASNEAVHFYLGGPFTVVEITPKGDVIKTIMGQDLKAGELLLHVVAPGHWFGMFPNKGTEFSLMCNRLSRF